MMLGSYYYKLKGKAALKGNWQTAMVVTFFSGIFLTISEVFQSLKMPIYIYTAGDQPMLYMEPIAPDIMMIYGLLMLLSLVMTPVLNLSCNHYFVERLRGNELGWAGLWCRFSSFGKALWLYVRMGVQIFLWGLLLVVPGIIAAIRYSLAPYYLAENPDMTVAEALEESKKTMQGLKASYFSLLLSFIGWSFLANALQLMLMDVNSILSIMVGLFMQVWISTYVNAAIASFYLTVSSEKGMQTAQREMEQRMRDMGIDPSQMNNRMPLRPDEPTDTSDEADDKACDDGVDHETEDHKPNNNAPDDGGGEA